MTKETNKERERERGGGEGNRNFECGKEIERESKRPKRLEQSFAPIENIKMYVVVLCRYAMTHDFL